MKANEVVQKLQENNWLYPVSIKLFPFIRKMATPPISTMGTELTIRIPTGQLTRYGKPKPQRRRFDALALVQPFYSAWGKDSFTVGFEIKVSKSDLKGDKKIPEYLGYTDLFFIAIPKSLSETALEVASQSDAIGVIQVNPFKLVKMPVRQDVPDHHKGEVLQELIFKGIKADGLSNGGVPEGGIMEGLEDFPTKIDVAASPIPPIKGRCPSEDCNFFFNQQCYEGEPDHTDCKHYPAMKRAVVKSIFHPPGFLPGDPVSTPDGEGIVETAGSYLYFNRHGDLVCLPSYSILLASGDVVQYGAALVDGLGKDETMEEEK